MGERLFTAFQAVEVENRTGSNTYACELTFFDDLTCTRVIRHHLYECEPPFGSESWDTRTYEGRWRVTDGPTIVVEEEPDYQDRWEVSGSPGQRDTTTRKTRDQVPPVVVEVLPLLEGRVVGSNTGASNRRGTDIRRTEGDAAVFLAFVRGMLAGLTAG